jgi:hypothetical protein
MKLAKRFNKLFRSHKLKRAFQAVRFDMDALESENKALKLSTNEWVIFLDQENRFLHARINDLEKKLDSLEDEKLTVLRNI